MILSLACEFQRSPSSWRVLHKNTGVEWALRNVSSIVTSYNYLPARDDPAGEWQSWDLTLGLGIFPSPWSQLTATPPLLRIDVPQTAVPFLKIPFDFFHFSSLHPISPFIIFSMGVYSFLCTCSLCWNRAGSYVLFPPYSQPTFCLQKSFVLAK